MAITPAQAAAKWQQRLSQSRQQIIDGVNGVTVAPGAKAAAQKNYWLLRVQNSADKWARNVGRVTLEEWKASMINIGIDRVATGAAAKVGKVEAFMNEFLPYVNSAAERVRAMPKGGEAEAIARASAMIQANMRFKRSGA